MLHTIRVERAWSSQVFGLCQRRTAGLRDLTVTAIIPVVSGSWYNQQIMAK